MVSLRLVFGWDGEVVCEEEVGAGTRAQGWGQGEMGSARLM